MKFRNWGNKTNETIILLHGGGLSWWSYQNIIPILFEEYHVITVIIDGHGEDHSNPFVSITDSAEKLIAHIDNTCNQEVFAIIGLSIGAQIAVEVMSTRKNITKFAIIESALVYPMKSMRIATTPLINMSYRLIRKKWFSRLQAKALSLPKEMWEQYYEDSLMISKQTITNMALSNQSYELRDSISDTAAKTLIIAGEKEAKIIRKSARLLAEKIKNSQLYIAESRKHGELSLAYPDDYLDLITSFFSNHLP